MILSALCFDDYYYGVQLQPYIKNNILRLFQFMWTTSKHEVKSLKQVSAVETAVETA